MTAADILQELERRHASLLWQDNRLLVSPKGALDDTLRAAMRERRTELEAHAREHCTPFLDAVLSAFPGSVNLTAEALTERIEDHQPATVTQGCFGRLDACPQFSKEQLVGFDAGMLERRMRNGEGCGDCDLFRARLRLDRMRQKREEVERRQAATERTNRYVLSEYEEE